MKINYCLKTFVFFVLIIQVSSEGFSNDDELVPLTKRPLYNPQARIVGGNNANINQFPHQISLRINGRHICGGSIISKNYVLTAAHCVTAGSVSSLTIRAGTIHVNSGGVMIGVAEVKSHPSYRSFKNDIAVLRLSKSLEFNDSVKPIALAAQSPSPGSAVVTSGWGRIRTGGPTPQTLKFNTLYSISNTECRRRIGNVPTSLLCLGHTVGNGVCNGDSGGPAVYKNQLVGVTNFVVGGCGSNSPDGYASVAYFNTWIKNNTDL